MRSVIVAASLAALVGLAACEQSKSQAEASDAAPAPKKMRPRTALSSCNMCSPASPD